MGRILCVCMDVKLSPYHLLGYPLSTEVPPHFRGKSIDHICMGLSLNCLHWPTDLCLNSRHHHPPLVLLTVNVQIR